MDKFTKYIDKLVNKFADKINIFASLIKKKITEKLNNFSKNLKEKTSNKKPKIDNFNDFEMMGWDKRRPDDTDLSYIIRNLEQAWPAVMVLGFMCLIILISFIAFLEYLGFINGFGFF